MKKTAIVTTTIRVPKFLEPVCENVVRYNHQADVSITVIGDEKTPAEVPQYCQTVSGKFGIPITYLDIPAQEQKLARYPELISLVPHNSGVRKLLGGFIAWREGCNTLILIDDDNFPADIDLVASHGIVGETREIDIVETDTGWFNVYESVREERGIPIFPRGFPWGQRNKKPGRVQKSKKSIRIMANSGLVQEDPDVDAITRLFWPVRVLDMQNGWAPNFALAPGTWSSYNDQNAAYAADFVPIYFAPPSVGRNADIWGSFMVNRLAEHMGDAISFGYPLVKQFRNPHDLWKDLDMELVNDRAADQFVALLRSVTLTKQTYIESLGELIEKSLAALPAVSDVSPEGMQMMENFFKEYQVWQRVGERASKEPKNA